MEICLTPISSKTRKGMTHAYFPALGACFGFLEYLTSLLRGNLNGIGWRDVANWTGRFLPQPDYDRELTRVFFEAFRHSVAHRGISTGIWIDRSKLPHWRVTWKISADIHRPSCKLVPELGELRKDPPWPCRYTHRMHISLGALKADIVQGAATYATALDNDKELQDRFMACMRQLYPRN